MIDFCINYAKKHDMRKILIISTLIGLLSAAPSANAERVNAEPLYRCSDLGNEQKATFGLMSQGHDGFFFRLKGDLRERYGLSNEVRAYLKRMHDALAAKNITAGIVSIPVRGLAQQPMLNRTNKEQAAFRVTLANDSYGQMLSDMREAGFIVPDLRSHAANAQDKEKDLYFFFRRDHHWTPLGANVAASQFATLLKQHATYADIGTQEYSTKSIATQKMKHTMAQEIDRLCEDDIPPEPFPQYETSLNAAGEDALFGVDNIGRAALVGSSFSAEKDFNFDGFLAQETGLEIANYAISGGLLFNALISYTSSEAFADYPPNFLIWEAPGLYDFSDGTSLLFRQVIPAIHGECSADNTVATTSLDIKNGQAATLLTLDADKKVHGADYYLMLDSSNKGLANMTLEFDYDDADGEWFIIDRSKFFNNTGRFFVELSEEISTNLVKIRVDGLPNLDTTLQVRLCRVPETTKTKINANTTVNTTKEKN